MRITLTVFFEDPFWVGLFECREGENLFAAKVVFGAEPKDAQVLEFVLGSFDGLVFSPGVRAGREDAPAVNPKRRLRQAQRAQTQGVGTKSQQALQLARALHKQESSQSRRERETAQAQHKRRLLLEKKRAKHRGH